MLIVSLGCNTCGMQIMNRLLLENVGHLECDAVSLVSCFVAFRRNVVCSSAGK